MAKKNQSTVRQATNRVPVQSEVVDPKWLLQVAGAIVALSLACAYLTVCGLFWYAQWQLVLHPIRTSTVSPASMGLQAEPVTFGEAGQVHGWWFPSSAPAPAAVMMLPSGDGSAADLFPRVKTMHEAGASVLLFDYRGFGSSGGQHPAEATMEADSESALAFLTGSRAVSSHSVTIYGKGLGASLAVRICSEHPELPALILEAPDGDFAERARMDTRARIVPFWLLFHQDFPLADAMHGLATPKLLISYTSGPPPEVVRRAAEPKVMLEIPSAADDADIASAVRRFVDQATH